nr:MAG: ORF1 [Torque teno midi virus]
MPYFFRPYWRGYRRRAPYRRRYRRRPRRRPRRTLRRRRRTYRRHFRVRRKKYRKRKAKKITIRQWQPQNIVKCKIKGTTSLICCSGGREMYNFISHIYDYVPKDFNFGGGFTIMRFSLGVLYEQFQHWQNYWTKSNRNYDLCRYTGCKIKLFRDPLIDYVVAYDRNPPFTVGPYAYQSTHPQRMLLRKHRIIIRSQLHAPKAKPYKIVKIPPPRMLCTKWFFQKDFSDQTLFLLYAATADFSRMWMSYEEQNPQIGFISLNPNMFPNPKWGFAPNQYTIFDKFSPTIQGWTLGPGTQSIPQSTQMWTMENGLFSRKFLQTQGSTYNPIKDPGYKPESGSIDWTKLEDKNRYATWPVRYNPFFDKGDGNIVTSIILGASSWNPTCENCTVRNLPLWLALHGYFDWMVKAVIKTGYEVTYTLAIFSPYTQPPNTWLIPVDTGFYYQTYAFNIQINTYDKTHWFPTIKWQKQTMNDIVRSGPFMPRYTTKAGWDFHFSYQFFFKWGGALLPGQDIQNPENKETFPIPCNQLSRVQVEDPRNQGETSLFHPWDTRRGIFSERALKRILEDTELGENLLTGAVYLREPKRQKTQAEPEYMDPSGSTSAQVQELQEESSSEEEEETKTIQQQLRDQRKQQQQLRKQLLTLILETKLKQRQIAMQMGGLE